MTLTSDVHALRRRVLNDAPIRPDRSYVLYWMTAFRRLSWNHALDLALHAGRELGKPLVVLEALRADYPWASPRFHRWVMDGMAEHARRLARSPVTYYPYVEPRAGAGRGLLRALADEACLVVADDWPGFFHPAMLTAAADAIDVRLEAVDAAGLLPVRQADRAYPSAYTFRRFLQKTLPEHLATQPDPEPLRRAPRKRATVAAATLARWEPTPRAHLADGVPELELAASVAPVDGRGGTGAGQERLERFLDRRLPRYAEERNIPDEDVASGLSPYLHFGQISPHEILHALAEREGWSPDQVASKANGKREGWWRMSRPAESFLDELVTWREVGLNAAVHLPDYASYGSLPDWARATLDDHSADRRPHQYRLAQFDGAETHDPLWNAAQRQLRAEGVIHNYLRMLWGKKILEWSKSPQDAAKIMIELNNRYALDGRDPNSYSGIYWCLGRYDRPWGPERPIFGKIRYMTSANTARKFSVREYLERWGETAQDVES